MRMNKTYALAAASLSLIGAACGGGGSSPLETVQNAATATSSAKTASIEMKIDGGQFENATFTGAYDFDNRVMSFEMDADELNIEGASGTIDAVMDFGDSAVQYMKFPGLEEETGKSWLKIDLAAATESVCPDIDFAALLKSQAGDPTSGLTALRGAKEVKELGSETIRGEKTKHYRVEFDIREAAEESPEDVRETMREFASWYKDPIQTSEVWIDGEGRAMRVKGTSDTANIEFPDCLKAGADANPFAGKTTMQFDLFDFGKKVDIEVPAGNDVIDLADLTG